MNLTKIYVKGLTMLYSIDILLKSEGLLEFTLYSNKKKINCSNTDRITFCTDEDTLNLSFVFSAIVEKNHPKLTFAEKITNIISEVIERYNQNPLDESREDKLKLPYQYIFDIQIKLNDKKSFLILQLTKQKQYLVSSVVVKVQGCETTNNNLKVIIPQILFHKTQRRVFSSLIKSILIFIFTINLFLIMAIKSELWIIISIDALLILLFSFGILMEKRFWKRLRKKYVDECT